MTYNEILKDTTASYLESLTPNNLPKPADMAAELIEQINAVIEIENNTRPKGQKYAVVGRNGGLPPAVIADCVMYLVDVKKVQTAKETTDEFAKSYELRLYCESGDNEGLYVPAESHLETRIRELNYSIKRSEVKEVLAIIESAAPSIEKCKDPDLIPLGNGIFNYKNKQLLPFNPHFVFTSKAQVAYNPYAKNVVIQNADGTEWDVESWLADLHNDPAITNLLWQVIGAVLRPYVPYNCMVCFLGDQGRNGKGTVLTLIKNILGTGRYSSASMAQLSDRFGLADLLNANAVLGDENDTNGYLKSLSALKKLVTHDSAVVDIKHRQSVNLTFYGIIIQCLNELPRVSDTTGSFWRRQVYVPFEKNFKYNENRDIREKYLARRDVLEYIVYKVLTLLPDYYSFDVPEACQLLLEEVKAENDPIRRFVDELFPELGAWELYPSKFLYELYRSWYGDMVSEDKRTCSLDVFIKQVKRLLRDGVSTDWEYSDTPVRANGKMDNPEPLIAEYNLMDWRNPNYTGNDVDKICTPGGLKSMYRGIVKK